MINSISDFKIPDQNRFYYGTTVAALLLTSFNICVKTYQWRLVSDNSFIDDIGALPTSSVSVRYMVVSA